MKTLVLLIAAVGALSIYAWKDWYRSLCGLIAFSAFMDHPEMPRTMLGVPGLNAWNLIFFNVLGAWISQRKREGLRWDMPRRVTPLLWLGLAVLVFAFARLDVDVDHLVKPYATIGDLISDTLINPIKWVALGLLLFDGAGAGAGS